MSNLQLVHASPLAIVALLSVAFVPSSHTAPVIPDCQAVIGNINLAELHQYREHQTEFLRIQREANQPLPFSAQGIVADLGQPTCLEHDPELDQFVSLPTVEQATSKYLFLSTQGVGEHFTGTNLASTTTGKATQLSDAAVPELSLNGVQLDGPAIIEVNVICLDFDEAALPIDSFAVDYCLLSFPRFSPLPEGVTQETVNLLELSSYGFQTRLPEVQALSSASA